jgi:hypothetical protein
VVSEEARVLYPFASTADGAGLRLALGSRPDSDEAFFRGTLTRPERECAALLMVTHVAQSRFFVPPGMVERLIRESDPVITADGEELHFESFSQCCGVHVRLDLGTAALDGEQLGRGTTNVDFNPPMREALARLPHQAAGLQLTVGRSSVELRAGEASAVEKKVPLPTRWLKGFAESQALAPRLRARVELRGSDARAFLRSVPKRTGGSERTTLVPTRGGLRLSQRPSADGFEVGGLGRVRVLDPLARFIERIQVFADGDGTASGWLVELGGSSLELLLSPTAARGFSGEGQIVSHLASPDAGRSAAVRAQLSFSPALGLDALCTRTGHERAEVLRQLMTLAEQGMVGFNLGRGAFWKRELPFELEAIGATQPRLLAATELVAQGAVELRSRAPLEAFVASGGVEYLVKDAGGWSCNCAWYLRTRGASGPCKHVLAVQLAGETRP